MNYSITERESEDRIIPLAADRGVAVIINRPFMNGAYFKRLEGRPLPQWATEIGCTTWAQFSLKYILSNPRVTVVLTETSNPKHMAENAAGRARPDARRVGPDSGCASSSPRCEETERTVSQEQRRKRRPNGVFFGHKGHEDHEKMSRFDRPPQAACDLLISPFVFVNSVPPVRPFPLQPL